MPTIDWSLLPASGLQDHADAWRGLERAGPRIPVMSYEFVASLVEFFANGTEVLAIGRRRGSVVAIGLMQPAGRGTWTTFQPSQGPIGAWIHDTGLDWEPLLGSLTRKLPGAALLASASQRDPMRCPRPDDDGPVSTVDYISTSSIVVDRPFERYFSERDSQVRRQIKRRLARLAEAGMEPRLELIHDSRAVGQAIREFGDLESAGWKGREGTAIHHSNIQGRFYESLLARYAASGQGRIYRYVVGDRVLAMELCIEDEDTLVFLKTTFDEGLRAYSPGVLMRAEIFRHVFDEGRIRRIEFYGSVKEWQLKWVTETRTMYHVNCYRAPLLRKAKLLLTTSQTAGRKAIQVTHQAVHRWRSTGAVRDVAPSTSPIAAEFPQGARGPILRDGRFGVVAYDGFATLPAGAAATFESGFVRDLFFSADWFRTLSTHALPPNDRVRIYAVEEETAPGEPLLLLPMLFRPPVAGAGQRPIRGLQNYYASLFGPIVRADAEDRLPLYRALAKGLVADPYSWTEIDLHPLDRSDPLYEELATALSDAGLSVHRYFCFGNWYLDVAGRSYAQYLAGLPSKLRHTLERKSRAFARLPGARIEIVTGKPGLDDAIAAYQRVYSASWKAPEPYAGFVPALIHDCANAGTLRLGLAYVDQEPIGAQIWIVREGVAYIYKLAHDKQYAKLSAGTILTARLMQHVIDVDCVREVDYLTGDDAYKQDWMSTRRERWGILAYNPRTLSGFSGAMKSVASRVVKRLRGEGSGLAIRSKG